MSNNIIKQLEKDIKITPIEKNIQMRGDGRLEWICKHGIGHTIAVPTNWPKPSDGRPDWRYIHGCDGCCGIYERKQVGHI